MKLRVLFFAVFMILIIPIGGLYAYNADEFSNTSNLSFTAVNYPNLGVTLSDYTAKRLNFNYGIEESIANHNEILEKYFLPSKTGYLNMMETSFICIDYDIVFQDESNNTNNNTNEENSSDNENTNNNEDNNPDSNTNTANDNESINETNETNEDNENIEDDENDNSNDNNRNNNTDNDNNTNNMNMNNNNINNTDVEDVYKWRRPTIIVVSSVVGGTILAVIGIMILN